MNTILQVPIDKNIKNQAASKAERMGFSSLQEAVRIFVNKIAAGEVNVKFEETVQLSAKAIKRYNKIIDQVESGEVEKNTFSKANNLIDYLNED